MKPWDEFILDRYREPSGCDTPWRNEISWSYHLYSPIALHKDRRQQGNEFTFDSFSHSVLQRVNNETVFADGNADGNKKCDVRYGVLFDRSGSDLATIELPDSKDSDEECCSECWKNPKCASFSYERDFNTEKEINLCHLKTLAKVPQRTGLQDWTYQAIHTSGYPVRNPEA